MVNFGPLVAEISPVGAPQLISTGFASWQCYCTVLQQWASAKLCGVEQTTPPIYSRAAIIGPHSSSFLFFPRLILAATRWMAYTWCGLSANLECVSEMCCTWLAKNRGRKNYPKNRHLGTIAQLCRAVSSQLRHLLKQQYLSHMSPPYGELAPLRLRSVQEFWAPPANFNRFHVLAALLHGTLVVGISQTLRHWT